MRQAPYYRTKEFRFEAEKWRRVLKDSGFGDIETRQDHCISDLKQLIHFKHGIMGLTEAYFSWARGMVHDSQNFKNEKHQKIWEAHAEGLTTTEIGKSWDLGRHRILEILKEIKLHFKEVE